MTQPKPKIPWETVAAMDEVPTGKMMERARDPGIMGFLLSFDPRPTRVLAAMERAGMFKNSSVHAWMFAVSTLNENVSWPGVLEWRKQVLGEAAARQERQETFGVSTRTYYLDSWREGISNLLEALLDEDPELAHQECGTEAGLARVFHLSMRNARGGERHASHWLERSGVDHDVLMRAAVRCGGPEIVASQHNGWQRLDLWLATDERRQRAWDTICNDDHARWMQHADWMKTWTPQGQWVDSPLSGWCGNTLAGRKVAGPGPMDHPLFEGLRQLPKPHKSAEEIAELYIQQRRDGLMNNWGEVVDTNLMLIDQLGAHMVDTSLLSSYLDPLALAMGRGEMAVDAFLATEAGAARAQQLLDLDSRVGNTLGRWQASHVGGWILGAPSWQEWRDTQGNSVLDVWSGAALDPVIDLDTAIALARACPAMLNNPVGDGGTTLGQLRMEPETRSAVMRELLGQHAQDTVKTVGRKVKL